MSEHVTEHPRFRWLIDHVDGVLDGPRLGATESHLSASCATCESTLVEIRELTGALAAPALASPPAAVMRRAAGLFPSRVVRRVRELVAALVFDQRMQPAMALRATTGSARRILWTVGDLEVVVTMVRRSAANDLSGEILPALDDGDTAVVGEVTLGLVGGASQSAALDDEGAFRFDSLASGTYVLWGGSQGVRFRTPPFVVD